LILREREEVAAAAVVVVAVVAVAGQEEVEDDEEATVKTFRGINSLHLSVSYCNNGRRFTWGNPEIIAAEKRAKDDEKAAAPVEAKPVFELSGALARDTNKVNVGGGQIVVMK
jgi:hypothetical protein